MIRWPTSTFEASESTDPSATSEEVPVHDALREPAERRTRLLLFARLSAGARWTTARSAQGIDDSAGSTRACPSGRNKRRVWESWTSGWPAES